MSYFKKAIVHGLSGGHGCQPVLIKLQYIYIFTCVEKNDSEHVKHLCGAYSAKCTFKVVIEVAAVSMYLALATC